MTLSICAARDAFSQLWHAKTSVWSGQHHCGFDTADQHLAFCTAKDWLQDTSEALLIHRRKGFSDDPYLAYIKFWGVLQAIYIQQDAISELNYAVCGQRLTQDKQPDAWKAIRNYRNILVGHPNSKSHGETKDRTVRSVTGREPKSYNAISIHYHSGRDPRDDTIRLGELIDANERCAIETISSLFDQIAFRLAERT